MLPLIEMMLKSQNGEAFSQLQKQFGLDASQAEKALEAVLPAFSSGLKRNATKPKDFGAFMQTLSGGRHEQYADDSKAAFSTKGIQEGNGILGYLFGSKDVSRAVATQAAQASGVDEGTIKKMLPVVASMVMGGLFKQSTGQMQNFGNTGKSSGGGILGQILGELVNGGFGNQGANQRQSPNPRGRRQKNNPLGDILEQMMGGGSRSSGRQRNAPQNNPYGNDNPLGQIFEQMLGDKRGQYQPNDEQQPQTTRRRRSTQQEPDFFERDRGSRKNAPRQRQTPQRRGGGLDELFGDMFETGRQVDSGYQGGIESIFDKYMKR
ncbi:MAG: DUF937 domain-containing protein [Rhizobiaceae bacterium]|nr:DUF937 domain-containing protein [Rhizobiaceae bacterium]